MSAGAAPALELSAEEARMVAAVESMGAMAEAASTAAEAKPKEDDEAAGATPPCVTCGTHCVQCTDPAIVRLKGVKRVDGCTACAGKCPPRVLWVGRRDAVTVHTVGYGAAAGEAWRWHPEVGVWELGLRTLLPTNTKRNRFQWLQRHGHKARHPTLAMPLREPCRYHRVPTHDPVSKKCGSDRCDALSTHAHARHHRSRGGYLDWVFGAWRRATRPRAAHTSHSVA